MKLENQVLCLILAASSVNIITPSLASMPFSNQQKVDIIERINICQEPIFEDGYETPEFKLSIFEAQDGGYIYCGYNKATKAKILLPAVRGDTINTRIIWQARNNNVVYTIKFFSEFSYEFQVTKNGSVIYQSEAWSVYPP